MPHGLIFDVQRFCLHDGPGIRTVLFLKGCPLACKWCANPESQSCHPEIMFFAGKCIGCGKCASECPNSAISFKSGTVNIDRNRCAGCGKCSDVCPSCALQLAGRFCSVAETVDELLGDHLFFHGSGGGITVSGGEPLAQPLFLSKLLTELKRHNIHTAVETCGLADWSVFEEVIPVTDLFFFDLKHMSADAHKAYTQVDNKRILENLRALPKKAKSLMVRIPLIPGYNDDSSSLRNLVDYAGDNGVSRIELLPYHRIGIGKYSALSRECETTGIEPLAMAFVSETAENLSRETGLQITVNGI